MFRLFFFSNYFPLCRTSQNQQTRKQQNKKCFKGESEDQQKSFLVGIIDIILVCIKRYCERRSKRTLTISSQSNSPKAANFKDRGNIKARFLLKQIKQKNNHSNLIYEQYLSYNQRFFCNYYIFSWFLILTRLYQFFPFQYTFSQLLSFCRYMMIKI